MFVTRRVFKSKEEIIIEHVKETTVSISFDLLKFSIRFFLSFTRLTDCLPAAAYGAWLVFFFAVHDVTFAAG